MRTIATLSMVLLCCGCAGSSSATASSPPAEAQVPATTPQPSPIHVRVVGEGRPMILIPGLGCSGDVWRGAEQRFAGAWQLHIITVAGFAGTDPIEPPLLDAVRVALLKYIDDERLDAPVIVGHSLGAMLAFWLAGSAPDKTGPVIALDGVPYGAALVDPAATPARMRLRAAALRAQVASVKDDDKAARARLMYGPMVTRPGDLEWILASVVQSDLATVGQAMYELLTTDVRPQAAAITSPVLLMVAGDHFDGAPDPDLSYYREQLAGVESVRVVLVPDARHFVMVDAADFVYGQIADFLAAP